MCQAERVADLTRILKTIVASEPAAIAWTNEVAEPFVMFAQDTFEVFATAVTSSLPDCLLFRGAYSHARKMAGLAVLSALRQHKVENGLNLRQVVEATSLFGYLATHPGLPGNFGKPEQTYSDLVANNEKPRLKAFKWAEAAYPGLNADLQFYKDHINRNRSHVTVFVTASVYDFSDKDGIADQRFFDTPDLVETQTMLLATGNIINVANGMLLSVAGDAKTITLRPRMEELVSATVKRAISLRSSLLKVSAPAE